MIDNQVKSMKEVNFLEILYLLRLSRTSLGSAARESLVLGRQQQSILTEGFGAPTPHP